MGGRVCLCCGHYIFCLSRGEVYRPRDVGVVRVIVWQFVHCVGNNVGESYRSANVSISYMIPYGMGTGALDLLANRSTYGEITRLGWWRIELVSEWLIIVWRRRQKIPAIWRSTYITYNIIYIDTWKWWRLVRANEWLMVWVYQDDTSSAWCHNATTRCSY